MDEIWKDIEGFEGLYQVSNLGRVKSLERYNIGIKNKSINERYLKQSPDGNGYLMVWLYKGTKRKTMKVHRLVAEAFIPNPKQKPQIDHINAIRQDNRVENLRWCTEKENSNNPITARRNGESHFSTKSSCSIRVGQYTLEGELIKEWGCINDVERELNISHAHIIGCCKGYKYKKSAGGFIWRYL